MTAILYTVIVLAIIFMVLLPLAIVNSNSLKRHRLQYLSNADKHNPHHESNKKPVDENQPETKVDTNRWVYSSRNLHKAILKGRRNGHLRIVYHGTYYDTGLKLVSERKVK